MRRPMGVILAISLATLFTSCASPLSSPPGSSEPRAVQLQPPAAPKRVTLAILGDPKGLGLGDDSPTPGKGELEHLLNSTLTVLDHQETRHPQLAEAVPSLENGLWKVFPDGRMETTWKFLSGIQWHDGTPFTSQDLLFATAVEQDRDLPVRRAPGYDAVEAIDASDPQSITVRWKRVFLYADSVFGRGQQSFAVPIAKHLLERAYLEDKANFLSHPYWNQEHVGTGPFKLKEWVPGSHLILEANDRYVLGRPKIDTLEVKLILDQNTMLSNVLAGVVELTMGRGVSLEQATQIAGRWAGQGVTTPANPVVIFPKLANPLPLAVTDQRFRAALLHAIDRQQIVDTFLGGQAPIAHSVIRLNGEEAQALDGSIVRYAYDPRQTTQLLDELGFVRGSDGFFADAAAQRLTVPLQTETSNATQTLVNPVVVDAWQRSGVGVEVREMTPQEFRDPAWQWTFPGLALRRNPISLQTVDQYFHSAQIPGGENRFNGRNYMEYANWEFDGLIERFRSTLPRAERMDLARQLVRQITGQLLILGLYQDIEISLVSNRVRNVTGRPESWNAHLWNKE